MKTVDDRIKEMEQRLRQLKAQAQKINARKRSEVSRQARANDTRKKILVGALILDMAETSVEEKSKLWSRLNTYLTRDDDRTLFGLSAMHKVISDDITKFSHSEN